MPSLLLDPFGRWWVRDLGSRNGARVNGQRVTERSLDADDSLQVGKFTLRLLRAQRAAARTKVSSPPDASTEDFSVRSVDDVPATLAITATDLNLLLNFAETQARESSADERRRLLCELVVSERVSRPGFDDRRLPAGHGRTPGFVPGPIMRDSVCRPLLPVAKRIAGNARLGQRSYGYERGAAGYGRGLAGPLSHACRGNCLPFVRRRGRAGALCRDSPRARNARMAFHDIDGNPPLLRSGSRLARAGKGLRVRIDRTGT